MLSDSAQGMELASPGPGRSPSGAAPEAWSPAHDRAWPLGRGGGGGVGWGWGEEILTGRGQRAGCPSRGLCKSGGEYLTADEGKGLLRNQIGS